MLEARPTLVQSGLEMPWVLSGYRNSGSLTYETISIDTRYGNSRTGNKNREPKGQNCKADSAWDRCAPEQLPGGAQDRCRWDPVRCKASRLISYWALWPSNCGWP